MGKIITAMLLFNSFANWVTYLDHASTLRGRIITHNINNEKTWNPFDFKCSQTVDFPDYFSNNTNPLFTHDDIVPKIGKLVTMRIIGIDPCIAITGFGIIEVINNVLHVVSYGAINSSGIATCVDY